MDLIANRKGKRATEDEKFEVYRLLESRMTMRELIEITGRSEDSLRKYHNEVKAVVSAETRTQAEAYQHMVNPAAPPRRAGRDDDDDDDYDDDEEEGSPPFRGRRPEPTEIPAPPPVEVDLDHLFEDDDDIEAEEDNALPKKLYVLLLRKKAVKGEDAEETAADIARTYAMYPNYHNQPATVDFLKGHDIKAGKAEIISSLLFGWVAQQQNKPPRFSPGPVPGYQPHGIPGQPMVPPPPGYPPYPQPYQQYPGQPTMPGQYPYPWPQQLPPQNQDRVTKADIQKVVSDAVKDRDDYWANYIKEMDAKREKEAEKREQSETIEGMKTYIGKLEKRLEDQERGGGRPQGEYEEIEEPELDEDGNLLRIRRRYVSLESPEVAKMRQDYNRLRDDVKEERATIEKKLDQLISERNAAQTEAVKADYQGKIDLIEAKAALMDDTQKRIDKINDALWTKEKEVLELRHTKEGEMPEHLQAAKMQIDFFSTALQEFRKGRNNAMDKLLILAGKGRPDGVMEEQWSDEELSGLDHRNRGG